jgi:hypothetical protein
MNHAPRLPTMLLPEDPGSGEETEEEDKVQSFATTGGNPHLNQHQHDLPPDLASSNSGPPGLGTIISDPLDKALDRLPSLLEHKESALLELDEILRKPHTCTTFNSVISWLKEALHDNMFKGQSKLPRCKTLMKCLDAKFKKPLHKLVTVSLETGTKDSGIDGYHQSKTIKVPVWDFQTVVKSFLLDPILFGNRDNLVNADAPFEKFIVENPMDCKEYLAS